MPSQQQRDEGDTGSARRGPTPLACEVFQGINTTTTRSGVPDQQMFWCDGFIPLAPRNLRVMPGVGGVLYTSSSGVACFYFYNIGKTPYMVVFNTDGSVVQVRTTDGFVTTILGAGGGLVNPTPATVGIAQYGSQYLILVAAPPTASGNGYGVWDGSTLYVAGTLAPGITITNPGTAYVSNPAVVFSGGSGSGATGTATIAGGVVTNGTITNPGFGYRPGDVVTVTFVGGQQGGSGAMLTAVLSSLPSGTGAVLTPNFTLITSSGGINVYQLTSITVNNGGSGYSNLLSATWHNPAGSWSNTGAGQQPPVTFTVVGGVITVAGITGQPLWGTSTSSPLFPTVTVTDNAGSQFTVTSVTGTPTGTNYSPSTTITASGGGSPVTQATITPIIVGGVITGVNILNGGVYGSNTAPTLTANDPVVQATGKVSLMPFGMQGNTVETYAGHVWVANGAVVSFSAPGSVSDFASSDGGGTFTSSDSFLRVGYTKLIQTNGFLFLIGDSSMNYISGVQTNTPQGGNPTTTFTNNNSDPETGTPYPASVVTIGQDIFLANQNGVFVSTGGTFEKKSEPLDGVYNTAPPSGGVPFAGMQLSAAKALIFGKLVWMVLVPVIDPVTKTQRNKMFMFNQKYWWSSEQDVTITFIQSQEINSVFTAYGTDGTHIAPMFQVPSTAFTKRFQSRLWDGPAGYDHTKAENRLFAIAQFLGAANLTYNVFIDNEAGFTGRAGPYVHAGATADPEVFNVMPPTAIGQVGIVTGMTIETTADDMVIVSVMMQPEVVQYRG